LTAFRANKNSIIGHRGASGHAPENTLSALSLAAVHGAEWVEFDVKITADKVVILLHDNTLDRTTNGRGYAGQMTYAQISKHDAGQWCATRYFGQAIPTLQQAFGLMRSLGLSANIELKPCPGFETETAMAVAQVIDKEIKNFSGELIVSSFNDICLKEFVKIMPEIRSALLFLKVPWNWQLLAKEIGVDAIHCLHKYLTRARVKQINNARYPVRCFTVNSSHTAKRLLEWGVESLITDYPLHLIRTLTVKKRY
jgi:glycerophosphoryl diester phosphodiesterase